MTDQPATGPAATARATASDGGPTAPAGRTGPQLIAYADRLGGDVAGLAALLDGPLAGAFDGVHVLPFFTPFDGVDAGFDPRDHTVVDPRLGTWEDVRRLADGRAVMADVIVNHVSAESAQFQDVRDRGSDSPWAPMFLTLGSVFPDGATEQDLARIYRPRPGLPFTAMTLGGERHLVWTTFTPDQVDIDLRTTQAWDYLTSVVDALTSGGVTMLRLDAVGYTGKEAGTDCFMTPATDEYTRRIVAHAHARGAQVLVEVHGHYLQQIEIARQVDLVYDFALPPLVLHALTAADLAPLDRWLGLRPANAVTVLDTHDGIGIVDVGPSDLRPGEPGLLPPQDIDALVERIHANSSGTSRQATGAAASNLDLYQVNCTFYDALGGDDRRYVLARLIQLFVPGSRRSTTWACSPGRTTWSCSPRPGSAATSTGTATRTPRSPRRSGTRRSGRSSPPCGCAPRTRRSAGRSSTRCPARPRGCAGRPGRMSPSSSSTPPPGRSRCARAPQVRSARCCRTRTWCPGLPDARSGPRGRGPGRGPAVAVPVPREEVPMARTRHQEHRPVEERREQLLEAAAAVAREGGLAAVTTRTVTERAGLANGAFHYCFASRVELVEALLDREVMALVHVVGAGAFERTDPVAALRGALDLYLGAVRADPERHLLLAELGVSVARRDPERSAAARRDADRAVGDGLARWSHRVRLSWSVPIDALAAALTSAGAGLGMLWLTTRDDAVVAAAADVAAAGLAALCVPVAGGADGAAHGEGGDGGSAGAPAP